MNTCTAALSAAAIFAAVIICIAKPLRGALRFLFSLAFGTAAMFFVNAAFPKIAVGINPLTAFASGLLGLPGTAMVYVLKNLIC